MAVIFFLAIFLLLQGALGELACEQLPSELCSFSISSLGKRCILENYVSLDGRREYECKTSEVMVDVMHEWIETDGCINACGADRKSVGISSDALLQRHFTAKLCSPKCFENCPNIVDLYFNLALGEGVNLLALCEMHQTNPKRAMQEIQSSNIAWAPVAAAPMVASSDAADEAGCAPGQAPGY